MSEMIRIENKMMEIAKTVRTFIDVPARIYRDGELVKIEMDDVTWASEPMMVLQLLAEIVTDVLIGNAVHEYQYITRDGWVDGYYLTSEFDEKKYKKHDRWVDVQTGITQQCCSCVKQSKWKQIVRHLSSTERMYRYCCDAHLSVDQHFIVLHTVAYEGV